VAIDPKGRCEGKARGNLVPIHEIASSPLLLAMTAVLVFWLKFQ